MSLLYAAVSSMLLTVTAIVEDVLFDVSVPVSEDDDELYGIPSLLLLKDEICPASESSPSIEESVSVFSMASWTMYEVSSVETEEISLLWQLHRLEIAMAEMMKSGM